MTSKKTEVEIIPAVIEDDWRKVKEKLSSLEGKTKWVHLDASDGVFTNHKTWNNPEDFSSIKTSLIVEAHLMISNILDVVDAWLRDPIERIVFHYEAIKDYQKLKEISTVIRESGREAVVAVNPETTQSAIEPFLSEVDGILLMAVDPGWSGADFRPEVVSKIKALREHWPDGIIEVDGGVNDERAPELVRAGADRLVSSSFIWSFDDPAKGIKKIQDLI